MIKNQQLYIALSFTRLSVAPKAPPQSSVIMVKQCHQKCYTAAAAVENSALYVYQLGYLTHPRIQLICLLFEEVFNFVMITPFELYHNNLFWILSQLPLMKHYTAVAVAVVNSALFILMYSPRFLGSKIFLCIIYGCPKIFWVRKMIMFVNLKSYCPIK